VYVTGLEKSCSTPESGLMLVPVNAMVGTRQVLSVPKGTVAAIVWSDSETVPITEREENAKDDIAFPPFEEESEGLEQETRHKARATVMESAMVDFIFSPHGRFYRDVEGYPSPMEYNDIVWVLARNTAKRRIFNDSAMQRMGKDIWIAVASHGGGSTTS
jgi:hypothetical protein